MTQAESNTPAFSSESKDPLSHIPGDYGMPILGSTLQILKDPHRYGREMHAKYGPVYRGNSFFRNSVQLVGADANQLVLQDRDQLFSSAKGWEPFIGELFTNGLMIRDFSDHKYHRRIMQAAFKKPALSSYVSRMNPVIEQGIKSWKNDSAFHFCPSIKTLTLDVAANVFLGMALGPEADKVSKAFVDCVKAAAAVIRAPIPGLNYWRGLRGRAFLIEFLADLIPQKRASQDTDMFSQLCRATSEDGEQYRDDEIIDHMIFLMMAAHDTTTSALSTLVFALAKNPELQQRLREQCQHLPAQLSFDDLAQLEEMEWCLKEALRIMPPVPSIPRVCTRSFEIGGYHIPAGTQVGVSPGFTHRMEEYWEDPEGFDHLRFSQQRMEHKKHAFQWVPWGGGAHMCLGMHFADLLTKVFLVNFLRQYEVSVGTDYEIDYQILPIPTPKDGLPMSLTPIAAD